MSLATKIEQAIRERDEARSDLEKMDTFHNGFRASNARHAVSNLLLSNESAILAALRFTEAVGPNLPALMPGPNGYCPVCGGWEVTKGQGCQTGVHTKDCWLAAAVSKLVAVLEKK